MTTALDTQRQGLIQAPAIKPMHPMHSKAPTPWIFLSLSQPGHPWTDWNCSPAMKLWIFPALTTLLLTALHWNSHFPVTYHQSPAAPVHAWIPTGIPALLDKAGANAVPKESSSFALTLQCGLPNTQSCPKRHHGVTVPSFRPSTTSVCH